MPVNPMTSRSPLIAILLPAALAAFGCTGTVTPDDGSPGPGLAGTGGLGSGPGPGNGGKANGGAAPEGGSSTVPPAGGSGVGGAPITAPTSGPRPVSLEGHPIYTRFL